jgi:hypothetical protein
MDFSELEMDDGQPPPPHLGILGSTLGILPRIPSHKLAPKATN